MLIQTCMVSATDFGYGMATALIGIASVRCVMVFRRKAGVARDVRYALVFAPSLNDYIRYQLSQLPLVKPS